MTDRPPIAVFLKARRLELGLSLKEAAKRTGIQPSRLHDLEQARSSTTGKTTSPTRDNIRRIAKGLNVAEEFLRAFEGRPSFEAETVEEQRLVAEFRALSGGHRRLVTTIVHQLYDLDTMPDGSI